MTPESLAAALARMTSGQKSGATMAIAPGLESECGLDRRPTLEP